MKLSINILSWNTYATLHETLHVLIKELRGIDSEVIIVDNGSTDGCERLATIRNGENLGISKGKNQGIDTSKGDYILLLDGDIIPVPNSIVCLVAYLDAHPECQAIGFLPNKFTNRKEEAEERCENLEPVERYYGHCIYYGLYRRELFDKIKFDEQYGPGYGWEDLDFFMQMQSNGISQWVAGINHSAGRYYHQINSSLKKDCLGSQMNIETVNERKEIFDRKWEKNVKQNPA